MRLYFCKLHRLSSKFRLNFNIYPGFEMKKIILLVLFALAGSLSFAQQASDYFPQDQGYRWDYKVIPLDSANNEIDSLTYFRVDSFAVVTNFMGRSADIVLSKNGTYNLINYMPYTDSSFFSFDNADGYQYFRVSNLGSLTALLDTIGLDSTVLGVIQSLENWYSVFRFGQAVNNGYTIFTKDTSLNLGGTNFPLRFGYLGKRLDDETIQTEAGTFTCKKFLLSTTVSYLFGPIPIEFIRLETTKWIAQNNWLVQEIMPSRTIDLTVIGYGSVNVPGLKTELIPMITDVETSLYSPAEFELQQNYPNPFNPETKIRFRLPESGNVTLKVYDILGNEVMTLLEGEKSTGEYAVTFSPDRAGLSSGVYIYELKFKGMLLSHKMVYIK